MTAADESQALVLREAARRLTDAGLAAPRADAEQLLAHVLEVPRRRLAVAGPPDAAARERYAALVARRAAREPLQHLTGAAAFRRVELAVGPGVFVPRPETEVLAGWAVQALRRVAGRHAEPPVAVDLCTGSGAIAAALADEVPDARVHAVEIDPRAHAWAQHNLEATGVRLALGDAADAFADLDARVNVVVANPPYIPLDAWEGVDVEVRTHEPANALWSGCDGLDHVRTVERAAARLLVPGGVLGCEHADVQARSAPAVLVGTNRWAQVRDHADLADRPRFVTARRR